MKIVLAIIVVGLIIYLFKKANQNTKDIIMNRVEIGETNNRNEALKILQLSDLHLENISITPEELYQKLNGETFDIIAVTGDFLDRKRTIPKLIPYLKVLNKLHAAHGIYAVLGNHDYVLKGKNLDKLKNTLAEHNVKVMYNENHVIAVHGKPVNIIGIDDYSTKRSDISNAYRNLKPGTNLVLTHDPNVVLNMKEYYFDYLLSGHFHGGQICYPKAYHLVKTGKLARMNKVKGLHFQDGKAYYINEGLGQTGVNIRVGSRPEITIHYIALKSEEQQDRTAM